MRMAPFRVLAGSGPRRKRCSTMTTVAHRSERARALQSHSDRRVAAPRERDDEPLALASTALHWALLDGKYDARPGGS